MYWSNFLHIYQPPTQTEAIVRKVTDESYRTLVRVLKEAPGGKITLNISAVLTEQLARYGLDDVIRGLRELAERGQIEFTGSAMYHPILPLIPKDEAIRQVKLNNDVNQHYFGEIYKPTGFFPPEMCYSYEVAQTVAELGFRWIIVDEVSFKGKIGSVKYDRLYKVEGLDDFLVFFKERPFSAGITYGTYPSAEAFLAALKGGLEKHTYLLTGTDGEVYGHHRPGQEKLLSEVFARGTPKTCTISDLPGVPGRTRWHRAYLILSGSIRGMSCTGCNGSSPILYCTLLGKLHQTHLDFLRHVDFWTRDCIAASIGGPVAGPGGVWK